MNSSDEIECRLLTSAQMREALGGWSTMTEWRHLHDERYAHLKFPKPIQIGRRNYYRAREIAAWIEAQAAAGAGRKAKARSGAPEAA